MVWTSFTNKPTKFRQEIFVDYRTTLEQEFLKLNKFPLINIPFSSSSSYSQITTFVDDRGVLPNCARFVEIGHHSGTPRVKEPSTVHLYL